jgi:hypothetical protein
MTIYKSGTNHMPLRINRLSRPAIKPSNGCDFSVLNSHVSSVANTTGAVYNRAVLDQ